MKNVLLLGGGGSIGTQSIDVISKNPAKLNLIGISFGDRVETLPSLINNFPSLKYVCFKNEKDFLYFKTIYKDINFYHGNKGLINIISDSNADYVLNALIGFVGFLPSIKTLELNKTLLLANKESLIVGGTLINDLLSSGHGKLYPIDSEHVAIAKCLFNGKGKDIEKILITASGGPFFDWKLENFKNITVKDALNHPTWSMGKKITIDSSTMMNKCFEIIEAHHLFHVSSDMIEPIVDRKSYVHSMVKFKDGTMLLQVGPSDMRVPISYALFEGIPENGKYFNDVEENTESKYLFKNMDYEKFPLIKYAKYVLDKEGNSGAALNAVNEECVYAFLDKKINYIDIISIIDKIMKVYQFIDKPTLQDLLDTDSQVRELTRRIIKEYEN